MAMTRDTLYDSANYCDQDQNQRFLVNNESGKGLYPTPPRSTSPADSCQDPPAPELQEIAELDEIAELQEIAELVAIRLSDSDIGVILQEMQIREKDYSSLAPMVGDRWFQGEGFPLPPSPEVDDGFCDGSTSSDDMSTPPLAVSPKFLDPTVFNFRVDPLDLLPPMPGCGSFAVMECGLLGRFKVDPNRFSIRISTPSGVLLRCQVLDMRNSTAFVFMSPEEGIHRISVSLSEFVHQHIDGSPFTIYVRQQPRLLPPNFGMTFDPSSNYTTKWCPVCP